MPHLTRDPYALVRDVAALRASAKRYNPRRSNVPAHLAERNARTLAAIAKPKA